MGTIDSLERTRLARARERAASRRRRRSPLAWIGRTFGFIALGGVGVFLLLGSGIDRQFTQTPQSASPTGVSSKLAGYPTVVDGDTLRLNGESIRIVGVDAPEANQTCRDASGRPWACGRAATQRLSALIAGGRVECTAKGRDRYGRTLASCAAGSIGDLGGAMVRDGYAVNYGGYLLAEAGARLRQRGLWAGDFERPQDWRQRHAR
jgi:endonuclease YncB( thermonuclease family)